MKIAFDVDDTITQHPKLFSILAESLIASGHEVFVISDAPELYREDRLRILRENHIPYTKLVLTGDKRGYCLQNDIEYLFDDCSEYFETGDFETPIIIGKFHGK
jgi:hypothetical protein